MSLPGPILTWSLWALVSSLVAYLVSSVRPTIVQNGDLASTGFVYDESHAGISAKQQGVNSAAQPSLLGQKDTSDTPNVDGATVDGGVYSAAQSSLLGKRNEQADPPATDEAASEGPSEALTRLKGAVHTVMHAVNRAKFYEGQLGPDIYTTLKPFPPYSYAAFEQKYDKYSKKLLQDLEKGVHLGAIDPTADIIVAIKKVKQFRACESIDTLREDPETKGMFDERWVQFQETPDAVDNINWALLAEQKVNRVHVMENEIISGRYFRTMNIVAQTFVLAVLLPRVEQMIETIGRPPKIIFAGCGLGDWAVETLLEFVQKYDMDEAKTPDVTCYNYNYPTMHDGEALITDASIAFDKDLNPNHVEYTQQHLAYKCSEHNSSGGTKQGCVPHTTGFYTFQLNELQSVLDTSFDVVVYGNALAPPAETELVRSTLTENGFALLPVCTKRIAASQHGSGANCYCKGYYYIFTQSGIEGPLFPFGHVMRPWGTEGGEGEPPCTEHDYEPLHAAAPTAALARALTRASSQASIRALEGNG